MGDKHIQRHASAQDDIKIVLLIALVEEGFAGLEMPQVGYLCKFPDVARVKLLEPGDLPEFYKWLMGMGN
jgi:hypothetical protein